MSEIFTGALDGAGLRVGIIAARFNEFITARLLEGARDGLTRLRVPEEAIDIAWVPGCFEIPVVAQEMARTGRYDALICLGAVIRGETAHFDYVAGQTAAGIARAAVDGGLPVIFGVLTTDTLDQAINRAGGKAGNKGFEAAMTAVETATLLRAVRSTGRVALESGHRA